MQRGRGCRDDPHTGPRKDYGPWSHSDLRSDSAASTECLLSTLNKDPESSANPQHHVPRACTGGRGKEEVDQPQPHGAPGQVEYPAITVISGRRGLVGLRFFI